MATTNSKAEYYTKLLAEIDAQLSNMADIRKLYLKTQGDDADVSNLDLGMEALQEYRAEISASLDETEKQKHNITITIDGVTYKSVTEDEDVVASLVKIAQGIMELKDDLVDSRRVRAWAISRGLSVGSRGKIPDSIRKQYREASKELQSA